ncbi:MAG: resolvase [Tabrizicola sp.]|nr:resolvase [Tabrizicola sp.]
MAEKIDLFGNPVRDGHGQKGRPPFDVTPEKRNRVKLLLALGWMPQRIANAIDCSLATLKRYFRAELKARDEMRDRLDARRLEVAAQKAFDGNPSAMRLFEAMIERSDRMAAINRANRNTPDRAERAPVERPGKKLAKQTDAAAAITKDPDLFGGHKTIN